MKAVRKKWADPSELVNEHADYLLSYAMTKIRDPELAKDLVQDTLLSAIKAYDRFENKSTVRTWLTSILNRKIIDHWRKAETRYTDPVSKFFDEKDKGGHWIEHQYTGTDMESAEAMLIREEGHQALHDCIDRLPDMWKGIIVARFFEDIPGEDICKEYDITPSNLWVIVHRAKLLLRDCLQQKTSYENMQGNN